MIKRFVIPFVAVFVLATACGGEDEPVRVPPAAPSADGGGAASGTARAERAVVKLAAEKTKARETVLNAGAPLSCVKVTVTNQGRRNVTVSPLYFSITDAEGKRHDGGEALGTYENRVPTTTLAPGGKATGTVCGKGAFEPRTVAMTDEAVQEIARAEVG
ncbi:hypothetical protein GCM10009678_30430 [Actinomadura kijaniata]|uniref:DUF4352 domain-containing protein n=1 Tax=Actinomadura namibiensis TaxID=182080 RepID=A0A7W3LPN7_ACTNM|nr:DUF4352 domain-containing protein [Actinomadura namibiensis]MBA8951991.1 hypothetical protein [Actinomadura namibiensis]